MSKTNIFGKKNRIFVNNLNFFTKSWVSLHFTFRFESFLQKPIKNGGFTKYDPKLDFDYKSIPKLESNAKLT